MNSLLFVGIGGFFGAISRYLMTLWVNGIFVNTRAEHALSAHGMMLPYGTLVVNVLGSFGLAVFGVWFISRTGLSPNIRLLIGTGFFGAFTTFSTFANESVALFEKGSLSPVLFNIIMTNVLCLVGVVLGIFVAERLLT